mgnify:CR=1 FL=1|tara:strand:+ start:1223 stop:1768 length:546 start_codon:yes stop_codon:yes gene_type:complete
MLYKLAFAVGLCSVHAIPIIHEQASVNPHDVGGTLAANNTLVAMTTGNSGRPPFTGASGDMSVLFNSQGSQCYYSHDGGTAWVTGTTMCGTFHHGACSADGQYCVAASYYNGIMVSNDKAATWQNARSGSRYFAADVGSTGQYMTVGMVNGNSELYVSSDYGVAFTRVDNMGGTSLSDATQ